jgi:hypothetical protein
MMWGIWRRFPTSSTVYEWDKTSSIGRQDEENHKQTGHPITMRMWTRWQPLWYHNDRTGIEYRQRNGETNFRNWFQQIFWILSHCQKNKKTCTSQHGPETKCQHQWNNLDWICSTKSLVHQQFYILKLSKITGWGIKRSPDFWSHSFCTTMHSSRMLCRSTHFHLKNTCCANAQICFMLTRPHLCEFILFSELKSKLNRTNFQSSENIHFRGCFKVWVADTDRL